MTRSESDEQPGKDEIVAEVRSARAAFSRRRAVGP